VEGNGGRKRAVFKCTIMHAIISGGVFCLCWAIYVIIVGVIML
jgi:hypothetical protein